MDSDQKIVSEMISTLDMSKYKFLSEKGQKKLIHKMEKGTDLTPEQQIFLFLLKNYLTGNSFEYPKYILGPHYLVKLVYQDKTLYFFGEIHHEISESASCEGSSYRITPFLDKLFKTTHKPIDFFLEATPYERYTPGITGKMKESEMKLKPSEQFQDIYLLREKFQNCYGQNKKSCPYTGVRVHYSDVRFLDTFPVLSFNLREDSPFSTIIRIVKRNLEVELPMMQNQTFFKKLYLQFKHVTGHPQVRETLVRYLSDLMAKYQKTFFGPIVKHEQLSYFHEEYNDLVSALQKNLTIPKDILQYNNIFEKFVSVHRIILYADQHRDLVLDKPGLRNASILLLEDATDFFESFSELFLDIYTLARMFRTYAPFREPENIIFYGGSYHSKNMVNILEGTGVFRKTVFPVYGDETGCIDISGMKGRMF